MNICKDNLTNKSLRELILGVVWKGPQAKAGKVVNELFADMDEREAQIKQFAKKYSKVGAMREGVKRNKEFYYADTRDILKETVFDADATFKIAKGKFMKTTPKL